MGDFFWVTLRYTLSDMLILVLQVPNRHQCSLGLCCRQNRRPRPGRVIRRFLLVAVPARLPHYCLRSERTHQVRNFDGRLFVLPGLASD